MSTNLTRYETARRALAEARRVDEVKDIRDKAEAMAVYARQAKDGELIGYATEIKLRAERRAGELLAETEKAKGTRGQLKGDIPVGGTAPKPPTDRAPTLKEIGVTKAQSSKWQKLAALPAEKFEADVARQVRVVQASAEGDAAAVKAARAEVQAEKTERRAVRETELGARQAALPSQRFGVILADPEWRFEAFSDETGMDRAAANHYPTSRTEEIAARDVASIAADDCALFLWATVPMLPDALHVMAAWGFAYKSNFVWIKDRIGTGYWNRNQHELLLIGTRGKVPAPAMGTQVSSTIHAPVGRHSEKPEASYQMIEEYFPTLPKIELNARGPGRPGWSVWGNEAIAAE